MASLRPYTLNPESRLLLIERASEYLAGDGCALAIYIKIVRRYNNDRGYAFPTHKKLMEQLGVGKRTITRSIKRLEEKGLVVCNGGGFRNTAKEYLPVFTPTLSAQERFEELKIMEDAYWWGGEDIDELIPDSESEFSKAAQAKAIFNAFNESPFPEMATSMLRYRCENAALSPIGYLHKVYSENDGKLSRDDFYLVTTDPKELAADQKPKQVAKAREAALEILDDLDFLKQKFSPPEALKTAA